MMDMRSKGRGEMSLQLSAETLLAELQQLADPAAREGMAHYGIQTDKALGIGIPSLRALAKKVGKDHHLAAELWAADIHEARILASMIEESACVSAEQMDGWVKDFDTWDICDQCCTNLFWHTPYAYGKIQEWSASDQEFIKRAGFTLMAVLAVHDHQADDEVFIDLLALIRREAGDKRNFVKKAVNWALRQIGKRNTRLNEAAITMAEELSLSGEKSAVWIGRDALRELSSSAIQARLKPA
jgi:3-methyladenine DNA glycosylase AlkD